MTEQKDGGRRACLDVEAEVPIAIAAGIIGGPHDQALAVG